MRVQVRYVSQPKGHCTTGLDVPTTGILVSGWTCAAANVNLISCKPFWQSVGHANCKPKLILSVHLACSLLRTYTFSFPIRRGWMMCTRLLPWLAADAKSANSHTSHHKSAAWARAALNISSCRAACNTNQCVRAADTRKVAARVSVNN